MTLITGLLKEREELVIKRQTPYLSYSRINRYLHCPEQYRLYYIENMRLKVLKASLVFGQIMHQSLALLFQNKEDPVKLFVDAWNMAKQVDLTYGKKESWEKLRVSGQGLLEKFIKEELPRIGKLKAAEKAFELNITSLDLPFIGIIDLIGEVDGKNTVADFKTSGSAYEDHEAALSDQLTAYQLAEPDVEQTALWVLIKTKEPKIEWHPARRTGEQLIEFLSKAGYVAREITSGHFYKRPGMWCSWCDFLPVCLGDKRKIEETLVKVR